MKRNLLLLVLFLWIAIPAYTLTLEIDNAMELILQESITIKTAEDTVQKARQTLDSPLLLDRSRISLSSDLKIGTIKPGDTIWDMITGSAQISVPIIPQVSFGVGLDGKGINASISLTPFSLPKITPKDEEAYWKALITFQTTQIEAAYKAEQALITYMNAQRDQSYAEAQLDLAQLQYEITQQLYTSGVVDYLELEQAANTLSSKRQSMFSAQKALLEKTKDFKSLFGPQFPDVQLTLLTLEELLERTALRRDEADSLLDQKMYSATVDRLNVEIDALEKLLSQTWTWRPNLSLSMKGSTNLADQNLSVQASMSFSFSDLQTVTREDLISDIDEKKAELVMETYLLELEKDLRFKSMEIAKQSLEASLYDLEQALIQTQEAKLLLSFGDRTESEVRQVELSAMQAENQCYQQALVYMNSINNYLMLFKL